MFSLLFILTWFPTFMFVWAMTSSVTEPWNYILVLALSLVLTQCHVFLLRKGLNAGWRLFPMHAMFFGLQLLIYGGIFVVRRYAE